MYYISEITFLNPNFVIMKKEVHKSWKPFLKPFFKSDPFKNIEDFVAKEKSSGKTIYPKEEDIFQVFNTIPFEDIKVVVLGQDPYHGAGQAHGLSFSVPIGQKIPPSLKNMYKELQQDVDFTMPNHGNLNSWAKQGVFLLNAVLTVNAKEPASHKKAAWENFTDFVIETISKEKEGVVFLLWGNFAKKKASLIDAEKHLILEAAHPSPFSAYNGFYGCKHFSKTNTYLEKNGKKAIDWQIRDVGSLF
ncbi:MAG: uracil-DNA glycosylase [Planctomycetota bacterium]